MTKTKDDDGKYIRDGKYDNFEHNDKYVKRYFRRGVFTLIPIEDYQEIEKDEKRIKEIKEKLDYVNDDTDEYDKLLNEKSNLEQNIKDKSVAEGYDDEEPKNEFKNEYGTWESDYEEVDHRPNETKLRQLIDDGIPEDEITEMVLKYNGYDEIISAMKALDYDTEKYTDIYSIYNDGSLDGMDLNRIGNELISEMSDDDIKDLMIANEILSFEDDYEEESNLNEEIDPSEYYDYIDEDDLNEALDNYIRDGYFSIDFNDYLVNEGIIEEDDEEYEFDRDILADKFPDEYDYWIEDEKEDFVHSNYFEDYLPSEVIEKAKQEVLEMNSIYNEKMHNEYNSHSTTDESNKSTIQKKIDQKIEEIKANTPNINPEELSVKLENYVYDEEGVFNQTIEDYINKVSGFNDYMNSEESIDIGDKVEFRDNLSNLREGLVVDKLYNFDRIRVIDQDGFTHSVKNNYVRLKQEPSLELRMYDEDKNEFKTIIKASDIDEVMMYADENRHYGKVAIYDEDGYEITPDYIRGATYKVSTPMRKEEKSAKAAEIASNYYGQLSHMSDDEKRSLMRELGYNYNSLNSWSGSQLYEIVRKTLLREKNRI